MRILYVEPYLGGSHKTWIEGLARHSEHSIEIIGLPARHWKWRMHGGAISLARKYTQARYDLVLASSMLDVATFKSLAKVEVPIVTYFHENQLAYPVSPNETAGKPDLHYAFLHLTSALASDEVWFNSEYNRSTLLLGLRDLLKRMPDYNELDCVQEIEKKSRIVPLGMDFPAPQVREQNELPVILWNHRWEFDKNPQEFFAVLDQLVEKNFDFKLCVLGERFNEYPEIFDRAKDKYSEKILQWGAVESRQEYFAWLAKSDISIVTSHQDFFGLSVLESLSQNCLTFLPQRLAYPEILGGGDQQFFYSNRNELIEKILRWHTFDTSNLTRCASRYSWPNISHHYDFLFNSL